MNCAENSYDDRLHRCEVNVHTERIRQLAETKTVVTAMKTVVMEIRCRNPGKEPCLLKYSILREFSFFRMQGIGGID